MQSLQPCGDFWQYHSILFIIAMFIFPRITMLISGICVMPFAGLLFWLGWVFVPRLSVAIIATYLYFPTNPVLCVFTWLWAVAGERAEKKTIYELPYKR
jgi:hypothetical protein